MEGPLSELIHTWHDFYLLVGTASATLVGLMFVAASIGAGVTRNETAVQAFFSPTVVHFSVSLFACILPLIPTLTYEILGGLLILVGLGGAANSAWVVLHLVIRHTFSVDMVDRMFYALGPVIGHLLVAVAGALLAEHSAWGLSVLAGALILLLIAGIRNAWDMTIWVVTRPASPPPPAT